MGKVNAKQPPQTVLDDFGLDEKPSRLEGGEGRAYAAGDVVLKPIALPAEAVWVAETLSRVQGQGFRVEQPVRTINGEWLSGHWSAWRRLEGDHDRQGRWEDVLRVTEAFHRSLEDLPRPDFLDVRNTQWDVGDRVAWGDVDVRVTEPIGPMVEEVRAKLRPLDLPTQVIHGDMPRNVLFAEGLPPAVIDFSPYYRPAGFASAIVVVDALTWYGANESILRLVSHVPEIHQLLMRAAIYRLVTTATAFVEDSDRLDREVDASRPTIDLLDRFGLMT